MPRKTADREIAAQAAPKRRRVAGEENPRSGLRQGHPQPDHSWHPFQFYREAEAFIRLEAQRPEDYRPGAIIRHRKAKERFEKREREAKERAAAEKKKAKAAEVAARETVDADELRRLEMEQREAKKRAAAEKKKAAKLAYKAAEQASWMTQIEIDLARSNDPASLKASGGRGRAVNRYEP